MKKVTRSQWMLSMVLLASASIAQAGGGAREHVDVAGQHIFNTDTEVNGATILHRDYRNKVVTATVTTNALDPYFAYSIWWVVFNKPQFCVVPYACGLADLEVNGGDPRVKNSVFYGGGMVADGSGTANTVMVLNTGRTKRELFAMSKPWGLQNLQGAEIHVVVRSHGMAGIAGTVAQQIGTANDACPMAGCANVLASVHLSTLAP